MMGINNRIERRTVFSQTGKRVNSGKPWLVCALLLATLLDAAAMSASTDYGPLLLSKCPAWTAQWIAPRGVAKARNVFFRARRSFQVTGSLPRNSLLLHIAAESTYRLYVNGTELGNGPARGSSTVNFVDSYEIAPLLRRGENWIAALVSCANLPTFIHAPVRPALFVQLSDGSVVSDASWKVQVAPDWRADVPLYTFQVGYVEWHDLRKEPAGWQTGRDGSPWESPEIVAPALGLGSKRLLPRDIPALKVTSHLPRAVPAVATVPALTLPEDTAIARRLTEEAHEALSLPAAPLATAGAAPLIVSPQRDGRGVALILDFGQDYAGGFEVDVAAPDGTVLDVGYGEHIWDNRLKLIVGSYAFADRFILKAGRQTITNTHARGFRYLQLAFRSFGQPVSIHHVRAVDRRYPMVQRGAFTCSDALLNSIFSASVLTLSTCALDTFVDTPWREIAFWVPDFLVENVTFLQACGDPRLSARCLRLALNHRRPDGLIPGMCPGDLGNDRWVLISTNLFVPLILEEYLMYTGDRELARELMPAVLGILRAFDKWRDSEGLVTPPKSHWNFVDWSYRDQQPKLEGRTTAVVSFFHVLALDSAARLLRRIDRTEEAKALESQAGQAARAADRRFWSAGKDCYAEWMENGGPADFHSQLSHAVALLSGRVPQFRSRAIAEALNRGDLLVPELYLHHVLLRALVSAGRAPIALERVRRYWGPIVLSGSPTIWEAGVSGKVGKEAYSGAASLCHAFATAPISFFQSALLGVAPVQPGFARFSVHPRPCDLSFASGSVPTPEGNIDLAWKRVDGRLTVDLRVPPSTTAELPDGRTLGPGFHKVSLPLPER